LQSLELLTPKVDIKCLTSLTKLHTLGVSASANLSCLTVLTGLHTLTLRLSTSEGNLFCLSALTGLRTLFISDFLRVNSEDMSFLTLLTGLQALKLCVNGNISFLTLLTCLHTLELSSTNACINSLSALTGLHTLYLETDQEDMSCLSILSNLTNLHIAPIKIQSLDFLTALTELESLHLPQLQSRLPGHITSNDPLTILTTLKKLHTLSSIHCQNITMINCLTHLTGLKVLELPNSCIYDKRPLTFLTSLHTLDLSNTNTTDGDLDVLASLSGLRILDLSNTSITDDGLAKLTVLNELESLRLSIQQFTTIEEVMIEGCSLLTKIGCLETLPNLLAINDMPVEALQVRKSFLFQLRGRRRERPYESD